MTARLSLDVLGERAYRMNTGYHAILAGFIDSLSVKIDQAPDVRAFVPL